MYVFALRLRVRPIDNQSDLIHQSNRRCLRHHRSPLRIHEFTTDASNVAHEIGDLWQSLLFESMELNTSNSPIQANVSTLHGHRFLQAHRFG